ncbi:MAG: [protein-PII] uridylyltransferase [Armatimonadetes bacterium]|nr:[protein-PII] uridylyltransferase [Armatimonadota bacterium]
MNPQPDEKWLEAIGRALDSLDTASALNRFLMEKREALFIRPEEPLQGLATMRRYAAMIDKMVVRMLEIAVRQAQESAVSRKSEPPLLIVAIGGYGREELAPFSDIDISFIPAEEENPYIDAVVKRMFHLMMDVFTSGTRLKVGYAYRLIEDCAHLDHQTQTSLLDARYIAGNVRLFERLRSALVRHLQSATFVFEKVAERESAMSKYDDSLYRVEPNLKESPGGLRDIHTAHWLSKVKHRIFQGDVWERLHELLAIDVEELRRIQEAHDFLSRVRNHLHILSGKANDVLTMEKQESVAQAMGYRDGVSIPAIEHFMRDYYRSAEQLHRICWKLIRQVAKSRLHLEPGIDSINREIVADGEEVFGRDPVALLRIFHYAQVYRLNPGDTLRDFARLALRRRPVIEDEEAAGRVFLSILRVREGVWRTLNQMADFRVLQWYLPEFGRTMRLIPYSVIHRYTVGEHSLLAVRLIELLRETEDETLTDYKNILEALEQPEILFLAAMLHDVGKGEPEGDHSEIGAKIAGQVARRLGMNAEAATSLEFLVHHHLLMSEVSRTRDLNVEDSIRDFVAVVNRVDLLDMLFLLTYADRKALGPGLSTKVQARLLEDLYYRAERALTSPSTDDAPEDLRRFRSRLSKELSLQNLSREEIRLHTELMPAPYLLNTGLDQIALHLRLIERVRKEGPVVNFFSERGMDFTEMTVCAYDDPEPGLLSKIAGVLFANDVNIDTAQVFTRENGEEQIVIDTLWVDAHGRQLFGHQMKALEGDLTAVLTRRTAIEALLASRRRYLRPIESVQEPSIAEHLSRFHTVLEFRTDDQPGLLFRLTRALSKMGWNIHSAKIGTEGGRIRDVFYITDRQGRKISREEVEDRRDDLLRWIAEGV